MAVTATPVFVQAPKRLGNAQLATADTALVNPSTNQLTVFTAGANGSKVTEITVVAAQAAIAAGVVRIFVGASSTTGKLVDEFLVTAVTGSNTAVGYRQSRTYPNLLLAATELLVCTTSITQALSVTAYGGDF